MTGDIAGIFAGIVFALACIIPLKELKKEYAALAATALSVLLTVLALKKGTPLFYYIKSLSTPETEEYYSILFKCFGVALITHLLSEMCSDFGVPSASGKIEFIGKILILMTTVPVIEMLFGLVEGLL